MRRLEARRRKASALWLRHPQILGQSSAAAEAKVLISSSGGEAYWVARRRAEEASSEDMAKGWSVVAATIARKTGRRQSLLGMMFQ